jgi:hypothetical protein
VPQERYGRATEFAESLASALTGSPATVAEPQTSPPRARRIAIAAGAAVLAVLGAIAGWNLWRSQPPARPSAPAAQPAPSAVLNYSFTVQRYRAGRPHEAPFQLAGETVFDSSDRFALNLSSPNAGQLYLLNEGAASNGQTTFNVLYPYAGPNPSAAVAASQILRIPAEDWFLFDPKPGTENFYLVWSRHPVPELEAASRMPAGEGGVVEVRGLEEVNALRAFLQKYQAPGSQTLAQGNLASTTLSAPGDILVCPLRLEHR